MQKQSQLWQNNTETLQIIWQKIIIIIFLLEKGAILLINLAAFQQFEERLYLVCIFPEAVDHTVVSSHSLKHIGRNKAIGCVFSSFQHQTTFTEYLAERKTDWFLNILEIDKEKECLFKSLIS